MLSSSITRLKSMLLRPGLSRPTYSPFPTQSSRVRGAAKKVVNLGEFKPLQNPSFVKLRRGRVGVSHVNEIGSDGGGCRRGEGGEYHVIVGPMFAGKTTTLLLRMQAESNNGSGAKVDKDVRYGLDSIVTHDGLDVIGIDEAQFFEDLYDFCRHSADRDGETIIVAGLDWDYLRKSCGFDIIPLADSVAKLTFRCELCGKPALFTLRKTSDTQMELIAGADVYMPVWRHYYVNGQVVIETARTALRAQNPL